MLNCTVSVVMHDCLGLVPFLFELVKNYQVEILVFVLYLRQIILGKSILKKSEGNTTFFV